MNLRTISVFDDVAVCDYAIHIDEKAAAAGKLYAARVKGCNRYGGRLYATDQVGKQVLSSRSYSRVRCSCQGEDQYEPKEFHGLCGCLNSDFQ